MTSENDKRLAVEHRAQNMLARREFSRQELSQRLQRALRSAERLRQRQPTGERLKTGDAVEPCDRCDVVRADAELIGEVLDRLETLGALSDERFVSSYIDSRVRRGKGPVLIRAELRGRGVDESLVERFLIFSDAEWAAVARAARVKRYGASLPTTSGDRAKQARFLAGRGFPSELIRRACNEARDH